MKKILGVFLTVMFAVQCANAIAEVVTMQVGKTPIRLECTCNIEPDDRL